MVLNHPVSKICNYYYQENRARHPPAFPLSSFVSVRVALLSPPSRSFLNFLGVPLSFLRKPKDMAVPLVCTVWFCSIASVGLPLLFPLPLWWRRLDLLPCFLLSACPWEHGKIEEAKRLEEKRLGWKRNTFANRVSTDERHMETKEPRGLP